MGVIRGKTGVGAAWLPYDGPLDRAEAGDLARRAKAGDAEARWQFVAGLTPLVLGQARKYAARSRRSHLYRELADAGVAHLWANVHQYDAAKGDPSTWSTRVACTAFRDEMAAIGYACRAPRAMAEGRRRTVRQGACRDRQEALRRASAPLDFGIDRLDPHAGHEPDPADAAEQADDLAAMRRAEAEALGDQERRVLCLRYRDGLIKTEAGKVLGLSSERVRQVETGAIRKLRDAMGVTP